MASFFTNFFTILLLLLCALIVLVVLQQKPSSNASMGSALGGGMAESAFGGEASSKLSKFTIILCVLFFVSAFGLALTRMAHVKTKGAKEESSLPQITDVVQKPKKKGLLTGQDNVPTQPVSNKQEQPISVDQKPATHSIAPISLKREEPTEEKGEDATQVQQVANQKITEETTSEQKLSTPAAATVFKLDTQPAIKDADQGTHSDDAKPSLSPLSKDTEKNSQITAEGKPSNGLAPITLPSENLK